MAINDSSSTDNTLAGRLHAALPQTQCTRCGYPDCAAYAAAIASGAAGINQCPPGGAEGVARLAAITGRPAPALNPANGQEGPRSVAIIDEAWCIGCTLCLEVCPTDAILGGSKMMHTVIERYCSGCELCIPVCPVDCISLENVSGERTGWQAWSAQDAALALNRYELHSVRHPRNAGYSTETLQKTASSGLLDKAAPTTETSGEGQAQKRSIIDAALASARERRSQP